MIINWKFWNSQSWQIFQFLQMEKNLLLNLAIKPVRVAVTYLYRYRMEKADTEKPSEKICGSASVSM